MSSNTLLPLLAEIVSVLITTNSFWSKCGGAQDRVGLTNVQVYDALVQLDPNWTQTLVDQVLRYGMRLGTLRQQTTGPNCVTGIMTTGAYYINTNMLFENNANFYFQSMMSGLPAPKLHRQMPFIMY
jgi:hypothetical protein